MPIKYKEHMKTFSDTQVIKKKIFQFCVVLRKLLEIVLHQHEEVINQTRKVGAKRDDSASEALAIQV